MHVMFGNVFYRCSLGLYWACVWLIGNMYMAQNRYLSEFEAVQVDSRFQVGFWCEDRFEYEECGGGMWEEAECFSLCFAPSHTWV